MRLFLLPLIGPLLHLLIGLLIIHILWIYFFLSGLLLRRGRLPDGRDTLSLAELVITSVAGMAATGLVFLVFGFSHLLKAAPILWPVLQGVLFWTVKRGNVLSFRFWRDGVGSFLNALTLPAVCTWILFLALAPPAMLPPTFSDAIRYHLVYAVDWAHAGRIYVNPFLRFPYYANNFLLFYSSLFILKLGGECQLFGWFCGLLTCLGIQGFLPIPAADEPAPPWKLRLGRRGHFLVSVRILGSSAASLRGTLRRPEVFLIPLSVALLPAFLHWLDVAMIDIPIGLFVLTAVLCAHLSLKGSRTYEYELIAIAAFCVGMKITLLGYLPLFLVSLILVMRRKMTFRRILISSGALIVLSLPWYVRNLIETGDPTPPLFLTYFKRPDPIFSPADAARLLSEPSTDKSLAQLTHLPSRMLASPDSPNFREPGINIATLLIYMPGFALLALILFRPVWKPSIAFIYVSAAIVFLQIYWAFTSTILRYSLHWFPLYVAWLGIAMCHVHEYVERHYGKRLIPSFIIGLTAVVLTGALFWPLRGGKKSVSYFFSDAIHSLTTPETPDAYLSAKVPGYGATKAVAWTLRTSGNRNERLLVMGVDTQLFAAIEGIDAIGDGFGPARYPDLFRDVGTRDFPADMSRLNVGAVIVDKGFVDRAASRDANGASIYPELAEQLKQLGFSEYRYDLDPVSVFMRPCSNLPRRLKPVDTAP